MLTVTRLIFALIVSLGLANSALANPISIDLAHAERASIVSNLIAKPNAFLSTNFDFSTGNLSYVSRLHDTHAEPLKKQAPISRVPEPSSLILLGFGLLGLGFLRRRKH
jgi:hypothetical protein